MTVRVSPSGPAVAAASATSDILNTSDVDGVTASDALESLSSDITLIESGYVYDQFQGGADVNATTADVGLFGDHRWSFYSSGGSLARAADGPSYIGAYAITANASNRSALVLSSSATLSVGTAYHAPQFNEFEFLGVPDTGNSAGAFGAYRYGLGSDPVASNFGDDGLFFEIDLSVGNTWRVIARVSGVVTTRTSSIAYVPHTLTRLRAARGATAWSFFVDDVLIALIPVANVPTALVTVGIQVEATAASAQSASLDEARFFYTRTIG